MKILPKTIFYLPILFTIAFSDEIASTANEQKVGETILSEECQPCPTSSSEFENLQTNLDSCLSTNKQHFESIQKCQEENQSLSQSSINESNDWKEQEFEIQIQNLEHEINRQNETNTNKINNLQSEKEELESILSSLRNEILKIQSIQNNNNDQVMTMTEELEQSKNNTIQCQVELETKNIEYEKIQSQVNSQESKQAKIEEKYNKKIKELRNQMAENNKELDMKKKSFRSMQDRYHDSREEVTKLERELRMMHLNSQRTYLNTTLVREDMVKMIYKCLDQSVMFVDRVMADKRVQTWNEQIRSTVRSFLKPFDPFYQKSVYPTLVTVGKKIKSVDGIEGIRLLIISLVEQGSTIALNYIQLTEQRHAGPRRFRLRCTAWLKYTKLNAEYIVNASFVLFVAYWAMKIVLWVLKLLIFGAVRRSVVSVRVGKKSKKMFVKKSI